jgi:hypothetical protein
MINDKIYCQPLKNTCSTRTNPEYNKNTIFTDLFISFYF